MALPFWDPVPTTAQGNLYADDPWDTVRLGGRYLPGICTVRGLPTLSFDKKKAGGIDGATITVNGYLPGPIEIDVLLWTQEQWALMQEIAPLIWTRPNKKSTAADLAIAISHPGLGLWGQSGVVVLGVSVPEKGPIEGTKLIKIKCVEFVPVQKKPRTKTARAASNVKLTTPLDPAQNKAGEPPSKTDVHPHGKAVSRKGGVS